MGYICKKYGIYRDKTIGYFLEYMWKKLGDLLRKNYGIYYGIFFSKPMGYI